LHKVGGCCFFDLVAFYSTCNLDGASKQQKFFRERGFSGIGVRNDRKCSSLLYFVLIFHERMPRLRLGGCKGKGNNVKDILKLSAASHPFSQSICADRD